MGREYIDLVYPANDADNGTVTGFIYQPHAEDRWEYILRHEERGEEWDSNTETYNGIQWFSREDAISAVKIALKEIEEDGGNDYFCFMPKKVTE